MGLNLRKLTLAWPNLIGKCTLSGGSYTAARPLANAQALPLQERARTTDATTASTQLRIDVDKRRTTGCFAIAGHNLSVNATVRVRVLDSTDATIYDSGTVLAWPPILTLDQLEWEDDNFWSGQLNDEQRAEYTPLFVHWYDPQVQTHALLIDIDDTGNSDGYIEFGLLYLGNVWQPEDNMGWDSQWGHEDATEVLGAADAGAEFFNRTPVRRTFACSLPYLTAAEAFGTLYRQQRTLGISGEVIVAEQLARTPQQYQQTMLARADALDPIRYPYLNNRAGGLNLREIL